MRVFTQKRKRKNCLPSSAEIEKSCVYIKECWNRLEEKVHSCFLNFLSLFIFVIFPRFTFFSSSEECFWIRCNININWNDNGCLKSIRTGVSHNCLPTFFWFLFWYKKFSWCKIFSWYVLLKIVWFIKGKIKFVLPLLSIIVINRGLTVF